MSKWTTQDTVYEKTAQVIVAGNCRSQLRFKKVTNVLSCVFSFTKALAQGNLGTNQEKRRKAEAFVFCSLTAA